MIIVKVHCFIVLVLLIVARQSVSGLDTYSSENLLKLQNGIIEYLDCEYNAARVINLNLKPTYTVLTADTNKYLLYMRHKPEEPQVLNEKNLNSVTSSTFNAPDQTVFIVHGWMGNWKSELNDVIKDAFLNVIFANIIVVDWSSVARLDYVTASKTAPRVARFLSQFLQFLNRKAGAAYSTMHLVGVGLGAHVAGVAARDLQPSNVIARITGWRERVITALDPAGPLWVNNSRRLKAEDALYVEAIHTNGAMLGSSARFGAVDFYPNGGSLQPGCPTTVRDSCHHIRAWQLFAATIRFNHLMGRRCSSDAALGLNMCYNNYLAMGNDDLLKNASGIFRLTTSAKYPYNQLF